MAIYTKTGNGWEALVSDTKAVSSFGSIVPDGNQTDEGTYTDDIGREWVWYEWATAGDYSATLSGGLYRVLTTSAGSNGPSSQTGQPGTVCEGYWEFGTGNTPITVGEAFPKGPNAGQGGGGGPSSIGDYSNQGWTSWGDSNIGRGSTVGYDGGSDLQTRYYGYRSFITGEEKEYAPSSLRQNPFDDRPGRSGYDGSTLATDGCVIIATVTNGGKPKPVQPVLTPATVVSAPVKVSGSSDPAEWFVKQTDGTRKKITLLPGNTTPDDDPNIYEVTFSAGTLNGILVGSGGTGGGSPSTYYGGGGGSGGVIGIGCNFPVILPSNQEQTYTIKVGGTTQNWQSPSTTGAITGTPTTIEVKGQKPFAAAIGGGRGWAHSGAVSLPSGEGASGGGSYGVAVDAANNFAFGLPGQGNASGSRSLANGAAAGGGYGSAGKGNGHDGGDGFNLKDSLGLDGTDAATITFLASVTDGGFIAGGGAGQNGSATAGGGSWPGGNGQNYTGAGGAGHGNAPSGTGACGMVLLIEDVG